MSKRITLAAARVNAGLTQEELANKLGVSRMLVYQWESGKVPMKPAYVIAFCAITGFSESDIFFPHEFKET